MRLRNNIFAAAFDYLKREKGIKTQKRLAELMGVSEDTITRILKDRTEVTEDIITKLQTASGCIFNLQWLRGEDAFHMLAVDVAEDLVRQQPSAAPIDSSSAFNAAISAYVQLVESRDKVIAEKEARIKDLERTIADKETIISDREARIMDLERQLAVVPVSDVKSYPFAIGIADDVGTERKNIK